MKKWEELSKSLSSGAEGSIVMVTTRSQTTSRMMAKVPEFQHQVGCLSEKDSWSLFKKLAFASGSGRDGETTIELECIGKEIVRKCQGLPIAVKTLGGLMWSKRSASEWQNVKDSDVWNLPENDVLPALKLSYDNLLSHIKRCFAYCCLFPKGYKMGKVLLIELWMANGFLPPKGEVDLYVIGEQIFNCLVSRSFLQDVQEDELFINLECKMHDLMHDLARYVLRHDLFVVEPGKELITPDEVLHLSSSCSDVSLLDQDLKRLRSLFIFANKYQEGNIMISQISKHVYLRILHLDGIRVLTLPESICKLKHLRYLNISYTRIHFLSESIIYLQNLQVLLLRGCYKLVKLPEGMRYMKNLRCLDNHGCDGLDHMPVGMKELGCIERLAEFVVGKAKGAQISELGDLNLLGGRLKLRGLENVGGLKEAKSADLKNKTKLVSLVLSWLKSFDPLRQDKVVVEGLEPNSSLEELIIESYMGMVISPRWMMNLGNLVKIKFAHCERCESVPSLGNLPSLRVIDLWFMSALKGFQDDEFPRLQELKIVECNQLVSLPSNLPKLERLSIIMVRRLVSLPSNLPKLERLDISYAESLVSLPGNLPKLERLSVIMVPHLVSLPSNLPKLERLDISYAEGLVSLPSNLPKLSELSISSSPEVDYLPYGLKELTSLTIKKCENLQRRCEKDKGEDWPKISYVPHLHIIGDDY